MARIHNLIRQVAAQSPDLAAELEREVSVLSERRAFGLNFERHTPEEVELPGRPLRRGDTVHVLPPRGKKPHAENSVTWVIESIQSTLGTATLRRTGVSSETITNTFALDDLIVVAAFRDPIYPGLVSTGSVNRGGEKPFHTVINGENFHALQTLLFTHRGKIDAIYIDPPYNTGARDWKYNNNYVENDDQYRHSKWLAFMERRLVLAKALLNPEDSVLIASIDEKEYLRLGLLLEQTFPEASIQMVSVVTNASGVAREHGFKRSDEYLFFVWLGAARASGQALSKSTLADNNPGAGAGSYEAGYWNQLMRSGSSPQRQDAPNQFFPIFVHPDTAQITKIGDTCLGDRDQVTPLEDGSVPCWPIRKDGTEGRWQLGADLARELLQKGYLRPGRQLNVDGGVGYTRFAYLARGEQNKIEDGTYEVTGKEPDGTVILQLREGAEIAGVPTTVWTSPAHAAAYHGSRLLSSLLPGRKFPFPKSLYAVEDALRFVVKDKPMATIVDFFAGSGTTAHAVMRLNRQDGGRRISISVTNNEVSADEQSDLRNKGFRPGDLEWESLGICEYITKPRIRAATSGNTPDGAPILGDYRFIDIVPIADGMDENVEFFTLTYESPLRVTAGRDFPKIAPVLWLRAGSAGRCINSLDAGWDVADSYGIIADLDKLDEFLSAILVKPAIHIAFVITDEDRLFEAVAHGLPAHVQPVRMYDAYLRNFELESRVNS